MRALLWGYCLLPALVLFPPRGGGAATRLADALSHS